MLNNRSGLSLSSYLSLFLSLTIWLYGSIYLSAYTNDTLFLHGCFSTPFFCLLYERRERQGECIWAKFISKKLSFVKSKMNRIKKGKYFWWVEKENRGKDRRRNVIVCRRVPLGFVASGIVLVCLRYTQGIPSHLSTHPHLSLSLSLSPPLSLSFYLSFCEVSTTGSTFLFILV